MLGPGTPGQSRGGPRSPKGFTLVELLVAVAVVAVLAAMAVPKLRDSVERARVVQAVGDLRVLETDIMGYAAENGGRLPESLADVGRGDIADPWGRSYRYLPLEDVPPGKARKDRFLVPLNSDFDLYSVGADGKTQLALTAEVAQDDVIRANDGSYLGLASRY